MQNNIVWVFVIWKLLATLFPQTRKEICNEFRWGLIFAWAAKSEQPMYCSIWPESDMWFLYFCRYGELC